MEYPGIATAIQTVETLESDCKWLGILKRYFTDLPQDHVLHLVEITKYSDQHFHKLVVQNKYL